MHNGRAGVLINKNALADRILANILALKGVGRVGGGGKEKIVGVLP